MERTARHWWSTQSARTDRPAISARRAYLEVLVVFGVFFASSVAAAAFSLAGPLPLSPPTWAAALPASIDQIAETVLCVTVPVLLVARRGEGRSDLGMARPGLASPSAGVRMAAWALLALIAGSSVTAALATGRYKTGKLNAPDVTLNLFHAAQAGFIEEIVVLAFVVVTLEQARRPRAEIVAVALLLRMSYHIYYGPGVVGIAVWASVFVWLFLRFRTIVPLIAVHSGWDVLLILADKWHLAAGVFVLLSLGLFVTAIILWLVERGEARRAMREVALPGWYPDPGGTTALRWFDGRSWTASLRATGQQRSPAASGWYAYPPAGDPSARRGQAQGGGGGGERSSEPGARQ